VRKDTDVNPKQKSNGMPNIDAKGEITMQDKPETVSLR
jgi:hypothetical protein